MEQQFIVDIVVVIALGMAAQWLAWRFRFPVIILLMAMGFITGPVLGWIHPSRDFDHLLHPLIEIAVAVILFEGSINLRWHEYRETGINVNRLVTLGLLLTWILSSIAAYYIAELSWPIALIFGAIIVVTGPTVIMPLLKHAKLKRQPAAVLKWEGIINDPLGALLAVVMFGYFAAAEHISIATGIVGNLILALFAAAISGSVVGYWLGWSFYHGNVPEYLKAPVALASVLSLYVLLNLIQEEAGLVAVTAAGVVFANRPLRNIEEIRRFQEYITVLLVSTVFILLTANIPLAVVERLNWRSAALLSVIVFVVRPLAVYLATLGTAMQWRQRILVGWIAPRGIVAAAIAGLFAPRLIQKGFAAAEQLLPLVFSLIAVTVVLHGLTLGWLARKLGLAALNPSGLLIIGASPWSIELAKAFHAQQIPVIISDESWLRLQSARAAELQTHLGQILSEYAQQSLELHEVSHLLAATANDAYNALVCTRFAHELNRNNVYQLPSLPQDEKDEKKMARTIRGRIAFDLKTRYEDLSRCHYEGWRFHNTPLSKKFTLEDFLAQLPHGTILISRITQLGEISLYPLKESEKPGAGDVIINYQPPVKSQSPASHPA